MFVERGGVGEGGCEMQLNIKVYSFYDLILFFLSPLTVREGSYLLILDQTKCLKFNVEQTEPATIPKSDRLKLTLECRNMIRTRINNRNGGCLLSLHR